MQQRNKFLLNNSITIRKIIAGLLLVLFAFGMTPKITLHDLVATHTDSRIKKKNTDPTSSQIAKSTFNCQCDNLVSESPFETIPLAVTHAAELIYSTFQANNGAATYSTTLFLFGFRGPPSR